MAMTLARAAQTGYIPELASSPSYISGDDDVMQEQYIAEQAEDGIILDLDDFHEWENDYVEWLEDLRGEAQVDAYLSSLDDYR